MVKNIVFDLGGVIITLSQDEAIRRFEALGVKDAARQLDTYTQQGIFGQLEEGLITAEQFRDQLSLMTGRSLTMEECEYAWTGYSGGVPERNLRKLEELRGRGYRLILLSNTNPFMQHWANTDLKSFGGKPLRAYFDACYLSYECKLMKPDERIFMKMLSEEKILPEETLFLDDGPRNVVAASEVGIRTYCPVNGSDWTGVMEKFLQEE